MRRILVPCLGALVLVAAGSDAAADGRRAGSVLVYPVQRSGPNYFTIVSVTNTNTLPNQGSTLVKYEYRNAVANPDNPFQPLSCTVFDRTEHLTPADTLSVLTSCHNATNPGGQEGFLVVSALDPTVFDTPWSFDWLAGSSFVLNASNAAYSVDAIPFLARRPAGQATDVNQNGQLDLDDMEYEGVPDLLMIDSFVAIGGSQLALLNLTGTQRDVNHVQLTVWNDNEFPLSAQRLFSCWFDQQLVEVSPLFHQTFLVQSTPHDPSELDINCDGTNNAETGWARIDSLGVRNPFGELVDPDGALLGSITAGTRTRFDAGHLLWESVQKQLNGVAFTP